MSFVDAFADLMVTGTVYGPTDTYNKTTGVHSSAYAATGVTLQGIKYNRSAAERYYSERFQPDVTDVFVTSYTDEIDTRNRLQIGTIMYEIEPFDNIGMQDDSMIIPLKEFT